VKRDVTLEVAERVEHNLSYAESRRKKRFEAAARLEELAAITRQMVLDLRGEGGSEEDADLTAYARAYWLRKQLGYVVASLGVGAPDTWTTKVAEREYGEEAGWTTPIQ
jgi:hypothetical protein